MSVQAAVAAVVSTTVSSFEYDAYGNLVSKVAQVTANEPSGNRVYTLATFNSYSVSTGSVWLPGLPTCSLTVSQIPSESGLVASDLIKASSTFNTYFTAADKLDKIQSKREGNIAYATIPTACEAAPANQSLLTSYTYDARGDLASTTVGEGVNARLTTTVMAPNDSNGNSFHRRAIIITNPVGESSSKSVDVFGQPASAVDPNGVTMHASYDLLGRTLREYTDTTQIASTAEYKDCVSAGDCLGNEVMRVKTDYYVQNATANKPSVYRYLDRLGRELRTRTIGFDGRDLFTKNVYDVQGNLTEKTLPYLYPLQGSEQLRKTTMAYDRLGRLKSSIESGVGTSYVEYPNGFDTVFKNVSAQSRTERRDGTGRLRKVTDNLRLVQQYVYDAAGKLRISIDPVGNTTTMTYNVMGQRTQLNDPDMGVWSYGNYDAFGNMRQQTDNKGQVTNLEFDALDRLTRRQEADLDSYFEYGTGANNKGKLVREYTKLANGTVDYQHTLSYDTKARLNSETYYGAPGMSGMVMSYSYTPENRMDTVGYNVMGSRPFSYKNNYDGNGFLTYIQGSSLGGTSRIYWKAIKRDAYGRVLRAKLGNGLFTEKTYDAATDRLYSVVTGALNGSNELTSPITATVQNDTYGFNLVGNLSARSQNFSNAGTPVSLTETFGYDAGNRLVSSSVLGQSAKSVRYDELGNIAWKSDVGSYLYGQAVHVLDPAFDPATASGTPTVLSTNVAGTCGGVHRVCKVMNGATVSNTLVYDANGNLRTDNTHTFQDASAQNAWMSFNQPYSIVRSSGAVDTFKYSPQHERVVHDIVSGGSTTTVYSYKPRLDSGAAYEYTHNAGAGTDENAYYIYAEGQPVGYAQVVDYASATPQLNDTRYFHTDHQGSITAVSNDAAQVTARYSFDIWGKRRNLDGSDDSAGTLTGQGLLRGYTGHEMMDKQAYIHMNGRIFDPQLARFISADPTVDGAGSVQGFNRYAYVHNNPGTLTDPSGFSSMGGFYIETHLNYSFVSISVTSHQDGSSVGAIIQTNVGVNPGLYGYVNSSGNTVSSVVNFTSPVPFTVNSEYVRATVRIGEIFQQQAQMRWLDYWMSQIVLPGNCWTNDCDSAEQRYSGADCSSLDRCFAGDGFPTPQEMLTQIWHQIMGPDRESTGGPYYSSVDASWFLLAGGSGIDSNGKTHINAGINLPIVGKGDLASSKIGSKLFLPGIQAGQYVMLSDYRGDAADTVDGLNYGASGCMALCVGFFRSVPPAYSPQPGLWSLYYGVGTPSLNLNLGGALSK